MTGDVTRGVGDVTGGRYRWHSAGSRGVSEGSQLQLGQQSSCANTFCCHRLSDGRTLQTRAEKERAPASFSRTSIHSFPLRRTESISRAHGNAKAVALS